MEEGVVWLHARVHARHLGWTSIAAVGSLLTQPPANLLSTQPFSSEPVQEPIATLLMMAQALLLARHMSIPLFSALKVMGKPSFLESPLSSNDSESENFSATP